MNDLAESKGLADQLSDEIGRIVEVIVNREMKDRVKSSVLAYLKESPAPVVQFAPDIKIPMQPAPVVNFSMDADAMSLSIASAIRDALKGMSIQAPNVTVNPKIEVIIKRDPIDITFERGANGQLTGAKLTPQKA